MPFEYQIWAVEFREVKSNFPVGVKFCSLM